MGASYGRAPPSFDAAPPELVTFFENTVEVATLVRFATTRSILVTP